MGRLSRPIEDGLVYHALNRGNNRADVFAGPEDQEAFLQSLAKTQQRYPFRLFGYCLMTNHCHLLMRIDERGMSRGMCELNSQYALLFNQVHVRVNHLFGKRYWSEKIESDERFRRACRYVVRNPVEAGLVEHPADYVWSSYQATVGIALGHVRVDGEGFPWTPKIATRNLPTIWMRRPRDFREKPGLVVGRFLGSSGVSCFSTGRVNIRT